MSRIGRFSLTLAFEISFGVKMLCALKRILTRLTTCQMNAVFVGQTGDKLEELPSNLTL